jgi:DNA mismatch repair protein MutH
MLERLRETSAYDRLSREAGALGDRLVEELSTTAQQVVLPALLKKIKGWIGLDLSTKSTTMKVDDVGQSSSYKRPLEASS